MSKISIEELRNRIKDFREKLKDKKKLEDIIEEQKNKISNTSK